MLSREISDKYGTMKILKIIWKTLLLAGKFIITLPGLYFRRKKGVKAFSKELIKAGMNKEKARELANEYKDYISDFRRIFNKKNIGIKKADN